MAITQIVIECKAPGYSYAKKFAIYEPLEEPECSWCHEAMALQNEEIEEPWNGDECWECPHCHHYEYFWAGDYGEKKIELTAEEWDEYQQKERTIYWLKRRYGTDRPQSIRDYWLK